jgi:hypothetical protein
LQVVVKPLICHRPSYRESELAERRPATVLAQAIPQSAAQLKLNAGSGCTGVADVPLRLARRPTIYRNLEPYPPKVSNHRITEPHVKSTNEDVDRTRSLVVAPMNGHDRTMTCRLSDCTRLPESMARHVKTRAERFEDVQAMDRPGDGRRYRRSVWLRSAAVRRCDEGGRAAIA